MQPLKRKSLQITSSQRRYTVLRKFRSPCSRQILSNCSRTLRTTQDHHSRRGLIRMVNQRRKLLDYLKQQRYCALCRFDQAVGSASVRTRNGRPRPAPFHYLEKTVNVVRKTFQYGDQEVTLETGRIARQASVQYCIDGKHQCAVYRRCRSPSRSQASDSSLWRCITSKRLTRLEKSPGDSSSAKRVPAKKRR